MESQMGVGFLGVYITMCTPFLLYLSAPEMKPTFTFPKNDLACFLSWTVGLPVMVNTHGPAPSLTFF